MISVDEFEKRLARLCVQTPLVNIPRRPVDVHVLLKAMALEFSADTDYAESEVDEGLLRWLREVGRRVEIDHVNLRRRLIDEVYLERTRDGSVYRLAEGGSVTFAPEVDEVDTRAAVEAVLAERERRRREHEGSGRG